MKKVSLNPETPQLTLYGIPVLPLYHLKLWMAKVFKPFRAGFTPKCQIFTSLTPLPPFRRDSSIGLRIVLIGNVAEEFCQ